MLLQRRYAFGAFAPTECVCRNDTRPSLCQHISVSVEPVGRYIPSMSFVNFQFAVKRVLLGPLEVFRFEGQIKMGDKTLGKHSDLNVEPSEAVFDVVS